MHDSLESRLAVSTTELPPCCVRIHPTDNSLIVLGTYKLEKETGTRHGSLDLYLYTDELTLKKRCPTSSAILDVKFSPFDQNTLISVHSTGNLIIWECSGDLVQKHDLQLFDRDTLITSVFFSPHKADEVLVTLTLGELAIVDLQSQNIETLQGHDLECWTGSFGEIGALQNVVFTGGDDSKLIAHDLRTSLPVWSTGYSHHEAGVVSILSPSTKWNNSNPSQLWTGLYDDHLRVLDLRLIEGELLQGLVPKVHHKENLGGGVWRLIPSPVDERVLSCCMYDGARIILPVDDKFSVDKYFKADHTSMCYGGDWASSGDFVATCSFYDNVVQVWKP